MADSWKSGGKADGRQHPWKFGGWNIHNVTHQYLLRRFGDGGQNIYTFCREVPFLIGAYTLSDTPARVHNSLSILLVQDNQISLIEGQERRTFSYKIVSHVLNVIYTETIIQSYTGVFTECYRCYNVYSADTKLQFWTWSSVILMWKSWLFPSKEILIFVCDLTKLLTFYYIDLPVEK